VLVTKAQQSQWRDLWSQADERTVFNSWDFFTEVDLGARLVIGLIGQEPVLGAWLNPTPLPYAGYQGVLTNISSRSFRKRLPLIQEFAIQIAKLHGGATWTMNPVFRDTLAFKWLQINDSSAASITPAFSAKVNLTRYPTTAAWERSLSSDRRHDLIKSELIEVGELAESDHLYKLLGLTFERQQIQLWTGTKALVQRYCTFAKAHGRINRGTVAGKVIGATLFLCDDTTAYYVIGANDPAYRQYGANTALIVDQVRHFASTGITQVDLLSVNDPNRGAYKLSLASEAELFFKVSLAHSNTRDAVPAPTLK
jgi:hypothetical protein